MTQETQIAKYLASGRSLTALEALERFGCLRLAARINDIRDACRDPEAVVTIMIEANKKRVARYFGNPKLLRKHYVSESE